MKTVQLFQSIFGDSKILIKINMEKTLILHLTEPNLLYKRGELFNKQMPP